jgi:cation:H+ antiporter
METALSLGLILVLLVSIIYVCALFTNAIEWVGYRFKLSEGAVGSVLAAVGTALPETLVPIIAIASGVLGFSKFSVESGHDIGIGAILGAPFLLGTLAMFVTAVALFYFSAIRKREPHLKIDLSLFRRDFHYFFPAYVSVFIAAFIPQFALKAALAMGLLAFYGIYVYRTLQKEHVPDEEFEIEPLTFAPRQKAPPTAIILGQVAFSLAALLILVHFFVEQINHLANAWRVPAMILSLIITPIATELPEKFNSVVWIRNHKDNLALGNITGAMVFQSSIPTAIGLLLTPWHLDSQAMASVVLCMVSTLLIYAMAWLHPRRLPVALLSGGLFYLAFVVFSLGALLK